jgi:hypothetical protein
VSGTAPLGEVARSVTPRFNLVGLLPSAVLFTGVGLLIASGAFSGIPSMHLLAAWVRSINVFVGSLLLLAVIAVALIFHPFQLLLVRILEGYWDEVPILRDLKFIGVEINRRRRLEFLRETKDQARLARLYPDHTNDLLPTRLGNVLRAAESRAGQRYGFTRPVEMLGRIYPYISASLADAFADARNELDIACRMCVVLWALSLVSGIVFAADGAVAATDGALLAVPAAAALMGIVSYRGAIRAGEAYGRFLFYVFELHRRDLIRALGYEPPRSPEAESDLIRQITAWLLDGENAPVMYRERPK